MGYLLAPVHVLILFVIFVGMFCLPAIFFILTMQKTLQKCAPQSRTIEPMLAWLYILPLVNLVMGFILVLAIAKTLRNEFNRRGIAVADPEPGQSLGIAMCVCACCSIIPFLGFLAFVAHIVLWIMYWVKVAEYSGMLDVPPQYIASLPIYPQS